MTNLEILATSTPITKACGIYAIYCIANNTIYIGQSVDIRRRINTHKSSLKKGTHDNSYLQASWNKYNESMFSFHILGEFARDDLSAKEEEYINSVSEGCFNCNQVGESYIVPESTRIKMSEARKGPKNHNYGKQLSEETKKKM